MQDPYKKFSLKTSFYKNYATYLYEEKVEKVTDFIIFYNLRFKFLGRTKSWGCGSHETFFIQSIQYQIFYTLIFTCL